MKLYMTESSGNAYKPRLLLEMLKVPYEKGDPRHQEQGAQAAAVSRDQSARPGAGARGRRAACSGIRPRASSTSRASTAARSGCRPIPPAMAEVTQWLALSNNELSLRPAMGARRRRTRSSRATSRNTRATATTASKVLEGRLKNNDWLALGRPTIADLACYPVRRGLARRRLQARGLSGGAGVDEARRGAAGLGEEAVTRCPNSNTPTPAARTGAPPRRPCAAQLEGAAGNLGFLYATDTIAGDLPEVLSMCRKATGVAHWVGTVGLGVCATGTRVSRRARDRGDGRRFRARRVQGVLGHRRRGRREAPRVEVRRLAGGVRDRARRPAERARQPSSSRSSRTRSRADFSLGGLTSSRQQNLQIADRVIEGGLSGVAFADCGDDRHAPHAGLQPDRPEARGDELPAQHHRDARRAARARRLPRRRRRDARRRHRAHRRPRLRRHRRYRAATPATTSCATSSASIPRTSSSRSARSCEPGATVMFCRRDAETAREDMTRMLDSIKQGLYAPPRGAVYYSCLGRGAGLFGPNSEELRMITLGARRFPARRLLLQRRDLAQPPLRLHRRADASSYEAALQELSATWLDVARARRSSPAAGSATRCSPSATGARCRACTHRWTAFAASGWCA